MGDFVKNDCDQDGQRPDRDLLNRVLQNGPEKILCIHEYGKAHGNTRRNGKQVVVQFDFNPDSTVEYERGVNLERRRHSGVLFQSLFSPLGTTPYYSDKIRTTESFVPS
jgi:hypothetical protein